MNLKPFTDKKTIICIIAVVAAASAVFAAWWLAIRPEQRITTIIKRWANDPASVQLDEMRQSKRDPEVWCGRMNARNRMGGMVGFRKFVISAPLVNEIGADDEIVTLLSRITFEDDDGFQSRWSIYCV